MKPLVVNLIAGPGTGKSSMMASIFSLLKWDNINCEMAPEYAKELVWNDAENILNNQIYIFGQQHNRIHRLLSKVDVIITDSPLLLSIIYDSTKSKPFKTLVLDEISKHNNFNCFLNRKKKYNPKGRLQTEDKAKGLDVKIKELMTECSISYREFDGIPNSATDIYKIIKELLKS